MDGLPVTLRLRDEVGVARAAGLARGGVPLPQGALDAPAGLTVRGPGGERRAVQASAGEYWPDGSIRWLSVAFLADVPRQGACAYLLERADDKPDGPSVSAAETPEGIRVDTGAVSFLVRRAPFDPLSGFPGLEGAALGIRDEAGAEFTAAADLDVRLELLEAGPVLVHVAAAGRFRSDGGAGFLDFELELEAVAGSAEVALDCRIVNREPGSSSTLSGWTLGLAAEAEAACCGVFEQVHRSRTPFALRQDGGGHTKGIFVVSRVESEARDWEDASEPGYRDRWEWAELQGRSGSGRRTPACSS